MKKFGVKFVLVKNFMGWLCLRCLCVVMNWFEVMVVIVERLSVR